MSKSAKRRHHTERLKKNWERFSRGLSDPLPEKGLSFGRIYSKDPYDCGRPGCCLCSPSRNTNPKERRLKVKRELKEILNHDQD
jgi:hypothetical protein